jgi:RNA-binding protein
MRNPLTPSDQQALKKQAQRLKPVVQTGSAGLSAAVLAEIDRALNDHELVKIKLASPDRNAFMQEAERACAALEAICIQRIGRTVTLYRPNPGKTDQT